ncbi:MAG: hypothetical protein ABIR56_11640 [Polaromonas sp.]
MTLHRPTAGDVQCNVLRLLAVTAGSWNLVGSSRWDRRQAARTAGVRSRGTSASVCRREPGYALRWAW